MNAARLRRRRSRAARASAWLALGAAILLAAAVLAHRAGTIPTRQVLVVIGVCGAAGMVAVLASVGAFAAIWRDGRSGVAAALFGLVAGAALAAIPAAALWQLQTSPELPDVSTDLADPPSFRFAAIPPPRPGEAERQKALHPEIVGHSYPETGPQAAFAAARALVAERGWQALDLGEPVTEGEGGWIEAVARSPIFAFGDEVAIRIVPLGSGSRVDMRSAAFPDGVDLGRNATAVANFLADLDRRLAAAPQASR